MKRANVKAKSRFHFRVEKYCNNSYHFSSVYRILKIYTGSLRHNNSIYYKPFQNLQSGSRSRRIEEDNHSNSQLFLLYAQTPLFQSGSPVSRIGLLDPTMRLDLRGGFEMACRGSTGEKILYIAASARVFYCANLPFFFPLKNQNNFSISRLGGHYGMGTSAENGFG